MAGPAPVASELDIELNDLARVESEQSPSTPDAPNVDRGPFASNDSQVGAALRRFGLALR